MDVILVAKTLESFTNHIAETAAPYQSYVPLPGSASPSMIHAGAANSKHKKVMNKDEDDDEDEDNHISPLYMVVGICTGIYAAYLSWTCNTAQGIDVPLKVLYAIFAYWFGLIYLVLFMIFRWGTCHV